MAPKRRGNKVVGSVVKTKVVQETVEVIVAADDDAAESEQQQLVPEALAVASSAVDVSGSTVVHVVEVTTPDGGDSNTTGSNAKQPTAAKRGRGRRVEDKQPAQPEDSMLVPQSQETQDPNEEQEEEDASKQKKQKQQDDVEEEEEEEEEEEQQPETPRVASERKATPTPTRKQKPKPKPQQQKASGGVAGKKRKARRRLGQASSGGDAGMGCMGGYKRYVWRVLKQVHPDLGVSGHAMQVLDMMMADMFERLADEAARLSKTTGRITITSREVQSAVRLVLPGDLGKHAIAEGTKAISKYMSYA